MAPVMPAATAIESLKRTLLGSDGTICGGATAAMREAAVCPAAQVPHFELAYEDVDIFHPSLTALATNAEKLLNAGAVPHSRKDERTLRKWKRKDPEWKTNSLKLTLLNGVQVNLVHKLIDKVPLRTALQQVSSFDFSMLGVSVDLKTWSLHDLGVYYWPEGQNGEYRFFPDREEQWCDADVGRFTGIRQADRYARYVSRGYNLQAAAQPLSLGYRGTAEHYLEQDDEELRMTGLLYLDLAELIETHDIEAIEAVYKDINPYSKVESLSAAMKAVRP